MLLCFNLQDVSIKRSDSPASLPMPSFITRIIINTLLITCCNAMVIWKFVLFEKNRAASRKFFFLQVQIEATSKYAILHTMRHLQTTNSSVKSLIWTKEYLRILHIKFNLFLMILWLFFIIFCKTPRKCHFSSFFFKLKEFLHLIKYIIMIVHTVVFDRCPTSVL